MRSLIQGTAFSLCILTAWGAHAEDTSTPRVLRFPADRSLGVLENLDKPITYDRTYQPDTWMNFSLQQGEIISEAQGDVSLPEGARVLLRLDPQKANYDFAALAHAGPGLADVYALRFKGDVFTTAVLTVPFEKLTGLRELSLWSTKVSVPLLGRLKVLKNLERFEFVSDDATVEGLAHVTELPNLRALRVYSKRPLGLSEVTEMARIANLQDVSLGGNADPASYSALANLPNLERLYISRHEVAGEGFEHIARLSRLKYLGFFDLRGEGVAALPPLPSLKELDISYKGDAFTGEQMKGLSRVPNLEYLRITARITDESIASLKPLTKLKTFELHKHFQDADHQADTALEHLKEVKSLEHVIIYTGSFSTAGLLHLTVLPRLRTLHCPSGDGFGDPEMAVLGTIPTLEDIYVRGEFVTDEGLMHLANLQNLRSLRFFPSSQVTAEGIAKLKAKLPKLEVLEPKRVRGKSR